MRTVWCKGTPCRYEWGAGGPHFLRQGPPANSDKAPKWSEPEEHGWLPEAMRPTPNRG